MGYYIGLYAWLGNYREPDHKSGDAMLSCASFNAVAHHGISVYNSLVLEFSPAISLTNVGTKYPGSTA